jgi:mRNA-degrading endonuclease RelE of RelBE toxin-antitoxin system
MEYRSKFALRFAPEVIDHLDEIERKHHRLIRETIDEQLRHTPEKVTRNRKPLEAPAPFSATWELRLGPTNQFRVFYEVDAEEHVVAILAIGVKRRERLFIGGEEFDL